MKRMGVDRATSAISSEELGKGGVEIVGDEGGDDVLFAIRDDEEMVGPNGVKVVLPSRTWVHSWLGTIGAWGPSFCISVHHFGF